MMPLALLNMHDNLALTARGCRFGVLRTDSVDRWARSGPSPM